MNKRIEVKRAIIETNRIHLHIDESLNEMVTLAPKGQMLVDSDRLSFIYLLETEDEFIYTDLPHTIWPQLKKAVDNKFDVVLSINEREIELINLVDELSYLIENIKDNANYGEEMEAKVTEIFSLDKE
ncbi:hypothetical protein [Metabacillus malikii]|uniref:UPF0738 protein J2S19_001878 n=1 Tax=Metabacillus malikii TaxID=1504265 RepID=A0ABT9ZEC9_9BACI|nr:hypothetical protein [Metabacillus malikii]MDQ0230622.1 hypothetical protein [Metabacillus malikii]